MLGTYRSAQTAVVALAVVDDGKVVLYRNGIVGAYFFAQTAANTFFRIHHCITAFPDGNGFLWARLTAGTAGNTDIFVGLCPSFLHIQSLLSKTKNSLSDVILSERAFDFCDLLTLYTKSTKKGVT